MITFKNKLGGDSDVVYHDEFYDKTIGDEQWIRLSDGCFRSCWNCYAPKEKKFYAIPEINRNKVRFIDMNFLYAYPDPVKVITQLGNIKVNKKVIHYHFLCGLDFTLFTEEILIALKKSRFGRYNNKSHWINGLQIAWDRGVIEKELFIKAISLMQKVGYKGIACLMLCNGKVSFQECIEKLLVLKKLRIEIQDCWYDNQKRGSVKPIYWSKEQCDLFGKLCRAHNVAIMQNQYDSMDILYKKEVKADGTTTDGIPSKTKVLGILPNEL
jgi:hypothetical protein